MRLTDQEAELVRASFRVLSVDGPGAAACFYGRLFEISPETRGLFVADLARQGVKLMSTLAPVVEDMAFRHLAYGVRPEHYSVVGEALQEMLAERLAADWTPEVAAAWAKA